MNEIQKNIRYHKAFKEVYLLIKDLNSDLYVKIPKSFIKILKENMDESYDISIEKLNTEGMMEETEVLMSLIYRDFLCSDELNQKLVEYDNNQIKQELERYNNIFEKENKKEETCVEKSEDDFNKPEETTLILIKKENIFVKFINKIKQILKI